jgi:hypothetical protein
MPSGALTLLEAAKWDRESLLARGVVETIVQESPIAEMMPMVTTGGEAYVSYEEDLLPDIQFRAVNATYTRSHGTVKKHFWGVAIAGGEVFVDNFIVRARSGAVDQLARQFRLKARATALTLDRWFVDSDGTGNSFKGLNQLISEGFGQSLVNATNGAAIDQDKIDEAIDLIRVGTPDAILLNRNVRRQFTRLGRNLTGQFPQIDLGTDKFGRQISMYDGIPLRIIGDDETGSQILGFDETQGSSNVTSSLYIVKFGDEENVTGLLGAGGSFEVRNFGEQQAAPGVMGRIEFYPGLSILSKYAVARVTGITKV